MPRKTASILPEICISRPLPDDLLHAAAATAIAMNPSNTPMAESSTVPLEVLAVLTSKYWGQGGVSLTVGFLDSPSAALRRKFLAHMNAWNAYANVKFVETRDAAQVRIARTPGGGYWSNVGTDILHVPVDEPTMNLDSFTVNTPESEFKRVVRHETGHTLGCPHEHTRAEVVNVIDHDRAIAYFKRTQGWSEVEIVQQVLTPLKESALKATNHADPDSIMCYWLPAEIMKNGVAVVGGKDIDKQDAEFIATVYPKPPSTGHA